MESPLSPLVAGLLMEDLEQTELVTTDREPKLWLRYGYVDNTLIPWKSQLVTFLDHLNGHCENLQFTIDIEE